MCNPSYRRWFAAIALVLVSSVILVSCKAKPGDEDSEQTGLQAAIAETRAEWPDRDIATVAGRLLGKWESAEPGPHGYMNTRWFGADGSCAMQTRWLGRDEEPAPPKTGTYKVVGQKENRIDVVFTMLGDEPSQKSTVYSYTIDAVARFAQVIYVSTEGDEVIEGEPFDMRYVATDERP